MTPFTFKALVTLDDGEKPVNCAPGATCCLVLRGHHYGPPVRTRMFNARITTDDDQPLRPGRPSSGSDDHRDRRAAEFFSAGRHFELLTRHEVGTVSRRLVTIGTLTHRERATTAAGSVSTRA